MSYDVYILPRDKDPRFRDELMIRVGDLKNFTNSLFYLAPTKLSVFCSPFFIFGFLKIQTVEHQYTFVRLTLNLLSLLNT